MPRTPWKKGVLAFFSRFYFGLVYFDLYVFSREKVRIFSADPPDSCRLICQKLDSIFEFLFSLGDAVGCHFVVFYFSRFLANFFSLMCAPNVKFRAHLLFSGSHFFFSIFCLFPSSEKKERERERRGALHTHTHTLSLKGRMAEHEWEASSERTNTVRDF